MIFVTRGASADFHHKKEEQQASSSTHPLPTPLFSIEECNAAIDHAEAYFRNQANGTWTTLPSGQYDVAGFWIKDIPQVHEWFNNMLKTKLFPLLVQQFPYFVESVDDLVVDNAYLFKYTPETGLRTGVHTDSGCLSFTIALNSPEDYTGGGTWFEHLANNVNNNGDVVVEDSSKIEMGQAHVTMWTGCHQGDTIHYWWILYAP